MEEKKGLRKRIQGELSKLSRPVYEDLSYQISRRVFEDEAWKNSSIIGFTISRQPEVDTFQLIRKAWEQGKRVAVPKCEPASKRLVFRELARFAQLESVYYGLLEPIPEETEEIKPSQIDLVIVPGLAFSKEGHRLGFGGGYYDRFLADYHGETLALAFEKQLVDTLPTEPHDIAVKKIITENRVLNVGS